MLRFLFVSALFLLTVLAHAQQPAATSYQYMHISYGATEISFLPAYNGKESIKVADIREEGINKRRAPLEAMSKVLTDASADGWEVVSVVPITSMMGGGGGFIGALYLLRKPK
ncbi:hypothetical protein GCM10028822_25610 [Hymenobacter terrigena]